MAGERLQKILAQAGIASRRAAEKLITEGRVRVNGRVVRELGTRADAHKDKVEVNGKRVVAEKPAYYVINKPREVVTTMDDPEGRATIKDLLRRIPERVYPVGRLDFHTSGVLLLTNDGEMAQSLMHPRKQVPKVYVVKLRGNIDVPELDALRNGVDIGEPRHVAKADVFVLREDRGNTWLQMTIKEGKNRQIHRMLEAIGHRVQRLSRVSFAGIDVEGMRPGEFRVVGAVELRKLKRDYLNPSKRAKQEEAEAEAQTQVAGPLASAAAAASRARGSRAGGRGAPKKRAASKRAATATDAVKSGTAKSGAMKRADGPKFGAAKRSAGPKGRGATKVGATRRTASPPPEAEVDMSTRGARAKAVAAKKTATKRAPARAPATKKSAGGAKRKATKKSRR